MLTSNLLNGLQRTVNIGAKTMAKSKVVILTGRAASTLKRTPRFTMKQRAMAPGTGQAFNIGQAGLAGASVVGMGALCYYGLGLSKDVGAIDEMGLWPSYVKQRIQTTYLYFGAGIGITAASAYGCFQSPKIMQFASRSSTMALIASTVLMIGSGMITRSIPYDNYGPKHFAWLAHAGIVGAVLAPISFIGGPLVIKAAVYTAGVVGGLSLLAVCAPSEKFLNMGGPLAMGLGVVFLSSIGTMFLPASSALGSGLMSISLYGGLALFGMFLLYDTQKVIYKAKMHPTHALTPFDPINCSLGIYLDTINIFIRIATMLAGGGTRRK